MKTPWYSILNRGPARPLEILIYDEIGGFGVSASELINQINAAGTQPILLRINSPGGSVFDGYAIYNALERHTAGVEVEIDGIAASIASYIAMAGKPVRMAENALLMIHNPTAGAAGESDDMRRAAEMLDKVKDSIIQAYVKKTGMAATALSTMMDVETWLSAEEAMAQGFVDEITAPMKAAALFDTGKFLNAPAALRKLNPPSTMKILSAAIATLITNLTGAAVKEDSAEADVQNALNGLVKKADLDAEKTRVTNLTTERDNLQSQFGELTKTANKAQTDLTEAQNKVTKLTTDLAELTNKHETATKNIGRLEQLCSLKGIDPKDAIKHDPTPAAPVNQDDLEKEYAKAKSPQEREAVVKKFAEAVKAKALVKPE